eukprot:TRINITY_DN1072_c0_g1_i2.p1 TRINITY_DN1072_c0_g1~~TRINITY_DN1072_c0_g1_i2.p1  ORF type:complete len:283 (-),score=80.29 TRINITY_DN1072_c0_g1_i2:124-972(-)
MLVTLAPKRLTSKAFPRSAPAPQRNFASLIKLEEDGPVGSISLGRKPVNSLNLELLTELHSAITHLEKNGKTKAFILSSQVPGIFSAGLDITEFYEPKIERLEAFWRTLQNTWLALYGTSLVTGAAITGHSPAGGCLLALSCDVRVMAQNDKYKIGLNETQLGIVAPFWFKDSMENVIGHRLTERFLQLGSQLSASEALKVGLVDQLVPEDQVLQQTRKELEEWIKVPSVARAMSKKQMREKTIERLTSNREADLKSFVNFCTQPAVQKALGHYLAKLKSKQ